ncbi:hypothetical protein TPE_1570 [Treponema pedis str. T A4]|uniref:Uncharacterized protein n=1 Tax=Treponema pedis str. T A4 TaxID=1291379 RepID=S5ZV27_9SPIR|nr:hypothetical protein TPE_1570 [Treponema pedis str. T A4]
MTSKKRYERIGEKGEGISYGYTLFGEGRERDAFAGYSNRVFGNLIEGL